MRLVTAMTSHRHDSPRDVADGSPIKDMTYLSKVPYPSIQKKFDFSSSKPSKTPILPQTPGKVIFDLTDLVTESEAEEQAGRIKSISKIYQRADDQQEMEQSYDEEEEDFNDQDDDP